MDEKKTTSGIEWKSKLVDLLIVILGITIAFQLNNWNESRNNRHTLHTYLKSFRLENKDNISQLQVAIRHAQQTKTLIDSLKNSLLAAKYHGPHIERQAVAMMSLSSFKPSLTTMENITATGDFKLIPDNELRRSIIATYNDYKATSQMEGLLYDFVESYLIPYFFNKMRFTSPNSMDRATLQDPRFENLVFGYDILLQQQINGYQSSLRKATDLAEKLEKER
ncbi:DUF6090 family protein [Roseivirga sp. BDSF3-8]|uniref:DUF6090 family protein n=1 Tax=Roseivirga sp. BDSF3-8 TaxID=3241598 RepID=UPI003531D00B